MRKSIYSKFLGKLCPIRPLHYEALDFMESTEAPHWFPPLRNYVGGLSQMCINYHYIIKREAFCLLDLITRKTYGPVKQ